jgi:hypothetical protein
MRIIAADQVAIMPNRSEGFAATQAPQLSIAQKTRHEMVIFSS